MSKLSSRCCCLMIGGVMILLSACKRGPDQGQQLASHKDSIISQKADTITPRIAYFTKKIIANPKDADSYWKRGILEVAQKKYDAALADYSIALKIDSGKADYYYSLADVDFLTGHTRDSKDAFEKCISLDPKNIPAMMRLGELYFYVKKYPEAIELINKAIKINPYLAKAYFLKGMIYLEKQDTTIAVSSMQTAVEQDAKYFDAYIQLGLIFSHKGNPIALDYFTDAINARPDNAEGYYDKGMFYQNTQDYDNAIKTYQQLLQVDSNYKFGYYNLGVVYYIGKQDYKNAAGCFTKALTIDKGYAQAYYGRGNCYEQLNETAKALSDFADAIHYKPGFEEAMEAYKELNTKLHHK
jgi:tetratricopeptide (TPR) repeat protein